MKNIIKNIAVITVLAGMLMAQQAEAMRMSFKSGKNDSIKSDKKDSILLLTTWLLKQKILKENKCQEELRLKEEPQIKEEGERLGRRTVVMNKANDNLKIYKINKEILIYEKEIKILEDEIAQEEYRLLVEKNQIEKV